MKKEDLWKNFENINKWINNCDSKSMILFGFIGAIGFLLNKELFNVDFSQLGILIWLNIILVTIFVLTYMGAIYYLFKSINPNITGKYNSLIFFGNITSKNYKKFDNELNDKNYKIEEDLQKQVHINSKIVVQKYSNFKRSLFLLGGSLIVYVIVKIIWL